MLKHSKKREAILKLMRSTKTHPSAEWVYAQLKPRYIDLSLGTVYRNLALFRQQGDIMLVATVNGQERYDANTVPHTHFICTECGSVLDVDMAEQEFPLPSSLPGLPGAQVDGMALHYYGKCPACGGEKQDNGACPPSSLA